MELGMCYLASDMNEMVFSGARFELFKIEGDDINVIKGTKSGIGYKGIPYDQEFEEHTLGKLSDKAFCMPSAGLTDQIGGEKGRMFGKKRFRELLISIQDKPMLDQKDIIYRAS